MESDSSDCRRRSWGQPGTGPGHRDGARLESAAQSAQVPRACGVEPTPHFISSFLSTAAAVSLSEFCEGEACQGTPSGIQGRTEIKASPLEQVQKSLLTDKKATLRADYSATTN